MNPSAPQISLILPAYNEAKRIRHTLQEAIDYFESRTMHYEIVVAADGNDGTREIVHEMAQSNPRLKVSGSEQRNGKGYGLRQAVPLCTGQIIGFSDADNKTPITEYDKFAPLLAAGADVVIGQRPHGGKLIEKQQKLYRRLGSRGFKIFMHLAVGLDDIIDTQCGFKFFRAEVARDLFARQQLNGYMFDVEILYLAEQSGYRIEQVEVRWADDGDSRSDMLMGNLKNFADVLKIRRIHAQSLAAMRRDNQRG